MAFWAPRASREDRACYPLRFVHNWLEKSGNHLLELFFEPGLAYHHLRPFVDLVLLARSHQCRHLAIHVTQHSALALVELITLPPGSMVNLESLVLEGIEEADFPSETTAITVFRNSPRLRKLTVDSLVFVFTFNAQSPEETPLQFNPSILPWDQLTDLMVTDFIRVDIFTIILQECTSLQFLRVSLDMGNEAEPLAVDQWLPTESVSLLSLAKLYLSIVNGLFISPLMDFFAYPALQHLHIRRSESQDRLNQPQPQFWTNSPCFRLQLGNLRYLSLIGSVGTVKEVVVLLESTPQVTNLVLDIFTDYHLLIPELFPPADICFPDTSPARPLPRLVHFSVHLEELDFPFPSHFIRNASDTAHFMSFISLAISSELSCAGQLQDISCQFSGSRLRTVFVIPGWSAGGSTRYNTDADLIEHDNRNYTVFDDYVYN